MIRLWNLLIYGEWKASKWEDMRTATYFKNDTDTLPIYKILVQRNQYGRIRRVRI